MISSRDFPRIPSRPWIAVAIATGHRVHECACKAWLDWLKSDGCEVQCPADPFISRERRNVLPRLQRFGVGGQCLFQVRGQIVDHTA